MITNFFRKNSKARMVSYYWFENLKQRNELIKCLEEYYDMQKERYGWITVTSIEDVSDIVLMQRTGIKELLNLVIDGKVDGVFCHVDCLAPFMFEILLLHKILLEYGVYLVEPEVGGEPELVKNYMSDCKKFLMQYSRRNDLKPVGS